jgi:hypothetical protein
MFRYSFGAIAAIVGATVAVIVAGAYWIGENRNVIKAGIGTMFAVTFAAFVLAALIGAGLFLALRVYGVIRVGRQASAADIQAPAEPTPVGQGQKVYALTEEQLRGLLAGQSVAALEPVAEEDKKS